MRDDLFLSFNIQMFYFVELSTCHENLKIGHIFIVLSAHVHKCFLHCKKLSSGLL